MAILLAVGAAIGWGAADFFGGASRRRTPVLLIVAVSELIGLVMLAPVLIAHGTAFPHNPQILLACVAGVGVSVELGLIYVALSRGEGFITAPVGGLGAAIAVAVGLIGGDPLNPLIAGGLLCALIGGGIRSLRQHLPDRRQLQGLTVVAAVGVGGDLAYAAASKSGALSTVSAISSLYPLTTVALGMLLQHQRAGGLQTAGVLLALLGAIALGTTAP
jgi:drug/metabolite transporter (DMT)-like permease